MRAHSSVAALMIVAGLCLSIPTAAGAVGTSQTGSPVTLADLAGSFSGTTVSPSGCQAAFSEFRTFDATYPGRAAIGAVNLHIEGCYGSDEPFPTFGFSGTFTITTSVGSLAGNVAGSFLIANADFELGLIVQSGTGAFATTTGALLVSIQETGGGPPSQPEAMNGSVTVPSTNVGLPANGATVSGKQVLDASASPGATEVLYQLPGVSPNKQTIATATPTYYGWLAVWDTTTVPNGTYTLQSVALYLGGDAFAISPGITITVNNPPTTSVLVPSRGATLSGSTYLDASATNATSVGFVLFGGTYGLSGHLVGAATPTLYGWLNNWNTTTVPNGSYALVSYASGAGGSTVSSAVSITVKN